VIETKIASVLADQRILVTGVARNCQKTLRKDVFRISGSLKGCKTLSWLVVESDSNDKTVDILSALEKEIPNFRFLSLGDLRQAVPLRTQRIAHCRNAYLEELQSNPLYSNIDYVVVADLDGVNELISATGFASCWTRSDWDVSTANQRGPYYDISALVHPIWSPNYCWDQFNFLFTHNISKKRAIEAAVYSRMVTISEAENWIEVDSAFGGLAIYRRQALAGVQYDGLDGAGNEICEHLSLHRGIKANGYRVFINPRLVNAGLNAHSYQSTMVPRIVKSVARFFRPLAKLLPGARNSS
jgi:hypothetical protein